MKRMPVGYRYVEKRNDVRSILVLAVPVIIETILQVLLGTADTYFISRIETAAISGIGLTTLLMNIYIAFFTALGVGATAIVSRYYGMRDFDKASDAIKQSVILSVVISLFLGTVSYVFSKEIFRLLGASEEMLVYAVPYFNAVAVPSVFLSLTLVLSSSSRALGDAKTPMIAVGLSCLLNIALDYFLIFGFLGFEGWGILGAGIATTISRCTAWLILHFSFCRKADVSILGPWKINFDFIRNLARIGIPSGLEKLFMRLGQLIYNSFIISLGTASYVSHNIAGTLESYTYLPALGFGAAAAALVGRNLGEGNPDRAKRIGLTANLLSIMLMVIMGIVILIFAEDLIRIFTDDPEIVSLSVSLFRIISVSQIFLSTSLVISSALQGAGDTKFPMYLSLVGIYLFRVILGYLFGITFGFGLVGIWIAVVLDIAVRSIILFRRFLGGKWKHVVIG